MNAVKKLLNILIFLAIGNTALAQSFTVEASYNSGTKKTTFTITRSGSSLPEQTINYRTVNLSAYAGQHYTAVNDSYTFPANETTTTVEVSESTPGTNYYRYQTSSNRTYRFEVLDQWGFYLASCDRTFSTGTSVPGSGAFNEKEITIYTDEVQYSDAGYDQSNNPHYINSSSFYNLSGIAPVAYYTLIGAELRTTLSLDAKEKNNGYQYIQVLINNISTCDNRSKCDDGNPGNLSLSRYMAGFDHQPSSANTTYAAYTFPVTSQPDNCNEVSNAWSNGVTNKLYKQKFNTNCRATDGRLIIPRDFETLVVRFNASGGGSDHDEWYAKNVVAHIQAVDDTAPTIISTDAITVSAGSYNRGNTFYISVPFKEIVYITGSTRKLSTEWGDATYESGTGTNVLTFKGTINCLSGTTQAITGYEGTITDLAGNGFEGSLNKTFTGVTCSDPSYTITYYHNGGGVATSNQSTYKWSSSEITLNKPYKVGYLFDGWTGSNGSEPMQLVTIPTHSHGNKTYTANWTQAWTGSGTEGDPYEITTKQGMDLLAQYVNGTNGNSAHDCSGVYFQLGEDIIYTHGNSATDHNYTTIGDSAHRFSGVFNGQGHTISGIRIYKNGEVYANNYHGLFGYIANGGTVRNVVMADARITGFQCIGGIAGVLGPNSTIMDCFIADNVTINSLRSDSDYHGGIVGFSQGSINRCISRATLSVSDANMCEWYGAIAGNAQGTISDCLAIGATVPDVISAGALIGYKSTSSLPRNYYVSCSVAGVQNATGVGVGGEDGNTTPHDISSNGQSARLIYPITLPDGISLVRTAYATLPDTGNATYLTGADIDGTPYAHDGATLRLSYTGDAAAEGYIIALYVNGVQATDNGNSTYTATMPAADATVTVGQTPILSYFWGPNDGESEDHPYTITTTVGLDLLATMVNAGNAFSGKFFELANDITYTHTTDWNDANSTENNYTAIGGYFDEGSKSFNGTFDGKGHTVSGIRIYKNGIGNTAGYQGLFGRAGSNSTIKNLTISDVRITGKSSVGGVAGYCSGIIENCHVAATVCIHAVQSQSDYHGGVVGQSLSQNSGCTSSVKLTIKNGITNCYSYGGIVGFKSGGFIGECLSVGVSLPGVTRVGAIAGSSYLNYDVSRNFFHDCTIGGSAATVGYTYNDTDYSTAGRAEPGYTVACAAGITASASGSIYASYDYDGLTVYQYGEKYGITYGGITYYATGTTLSVSGGNVTPPDPGYTAPFLSYSLNGADLGEDVSTFEMPTADATVTAHWTVVDFTSGHAGTQADPYIIYNMDQLNQLATNVNGGNNYFGKFIKLGADIEYDSTENNYTPIGNKSTRFKGSFDGDGHVISGIIVTGASDYVGLFGHVDEEGCVNNVTLANSSISGNDYVGGFAGKNMGTISNCRVGSDVTIGTLGYSRSCHGGIVGGNDGVVLACISSATVLSNGNSGFRKYASIAGGSSSGMTTIENCLVIGGVVEQTSSSGAIVGETASILRHNYYCECSVGGVFSNVGCYQDSRTINVQYGDIAANDGAVQAVASATKPAEIGAQIASYSNGLTVYEHGAYYNGTYYLRHDLAGSASALSLVQGTKDGASAYWGTFYDGTTNYELSEGSAAYTLGTDYKLYRLGTNGRTIPKGVAVLIIATSADATLIPAGTGDLIITDHATGGNQLLGSDSDVLVSGLSGTPYVLSISGGTIGFRQFSGESISAGKAYYLVTP